MKKILLGSLMCLSLHAMEEVASKKTECTETVAVEVKEHSKPVKLLVVYNSSLGRCVVTAISSKQMETYLSLDKALLREETLYAGDDPVQIEFVDDTRMEDILVKTVYIVNPASKEGKWRLSRNGIDTYGVYKLYDEIY